MFITRDDPMFQTSKIFGFESEFGLSVLYSYPVRFVSISVLELKYGKSDIQIQFHLYPIQIYP